MTPNLKPLEKLNGQFNVLTGLSHLESQDTKGDGQRRSQSRRRRVAHRCARLRPHAAPASQVKLATTADQKPSRRRRWARTRRIPSLDLTVDTASQGSCDSGDCLNVNTISWRNDSTPNMPENQPRVAFERLFGDGGTAAQRLARTQKEGSILDSVMDEAFAAWQQRSATATAGS